MATPVEMPKPGITVEQCLLAKWLKKEGDRVAAGDVLAEIETDKAAFEVTAPAEGTLLARFFEEGELVATYANICVLGEPGEDAEVFRPARPAGESGIAAAAPSAVSPAPVRREPSSAQAPLSPRARRFAREHGLAPGPIAGSGPGGRVLESDLKELYHSSGKLSFLARRRVRDGYQAPSVGTGPHGMILARDLSEPGRPLSSIRTRIAARMRDSLANTAQYTLHASADATALLRLREKVKARHSQGAPDVNLNEMIMFCAVKALLEMPELNAELREGALYQHAEVHLGFACDTPRGLLVPVVRNADKYTLGELSERVKTLTAETLAGTVSPDDLAGATFTVSNLGALGVESFTPILNPPQVAVLGVGSIGLRPVRREGQVLFVDRIGLSLTCDHQVIDGAPGARFLGVVREKIESIESIADLGF